MNLKIICSDFFKIANGIYKELGGGFNETVNQNALAPLSVKENLGQMIRKRQVI